MMVFRRLFPFILLLALACMGGATQVNASGSSIFVNGLEVIKLRASSAGAPPSERAEGYAASLSALINLGAVAVMPSGKEAVITVAGKVWFTVTLADGKAAGMTPGALAQAWAGAVRKALLLPPVKITASSVKAPVGAIRSLPLIGSRVEDATAVSSDPKIVKIVAAEDGVRYQAIAPGKAQIRVSAGNASDALEVVVQPMAAYFPQSITASVTGVPASRETVAGSVVSAINRKLSVVDGADLTFAAPTANSLGTGESKTFQVRVKATGPQAFSNEGVVTVTVRNEPIGYRSESELWYCNHPETIRKPGRVFTAALKPNAPARMLYHHINKSGLPLIMHVEAINPTNETARILLIPGDAEPNKNPVSAGFVAADRFFRSWSKYSGEVVEIPPYSILPISIRRMRPEDTVSGLCYLRLMEGGPDQLIVRTEARVPAVVEKKWKTAMLSAAPWRYAGYAPIGDVASIPLPDTNHIYPQPFKEEEVKYAVGGPYGFVRIGQVPIARQDNQGSLDGNFGVMYTIHANVSNPTSAAADVEIVYEASAGYGGALFLIDNEIKRTPLLQAKEETRVSRMHLEPGATKQLRLMTIPLSGSSYPCTITIRPVQTVLRNDPSGKS